MRVTVVSYCYNLPMSKKRFTEDSWRKDPWFRSLAEALAACKTAEETADFLRDIGSLSELQAWSERLEVARLLAQGMTYRDIAAKTGASTTTVTRVAKFLENGEGGYRNILGAHRHHRMGAQMLSSQHRATPTQSEERSVSPLQKYLERDKKQP